MGCIAVFFSPPRFGGKRVLTLKTTYASKHRLGRCFDPDFMVAMMGSFFLKYPSLLRRPHR